MLVASRALSPEPRVDVSRWLTATAVACLVAALARELFVAASGLILGSSPAPAIADINPWGRSFAEERDGHELAVCVLGLPLLFALVSWLARRLPTLPPRRAWLLNVIGLGAGARLLLLVRTSELETPSPSRLAVTAALALAIWGWWWLWARASRPLRLGGWAALATVLTWLVMASIVPASVVDHSYFYAPAHLWLQGEPLGSFYVQYNLLTLVAFAGFLEAGLWVHQVQLVLAATFVGWLGLYALLARSLLTSRFLALVFLLTVFVFRFVALSGDPSGFPQATVLRLDLWVPLLLAAARFGLASPKTALAFGLVWLLDDTFGLLFAGLFTVAVVLGAWVAPAPRPWRHLALVLSPLAGAAGLRVVLLGELLPAAARRYVSLRLGFLPISPTSLVWPLLAGLLVAVALGTLHRREPRARLGLFACALAAGQFVYFFGRSHELNLFSVAGAWLVPLFLVIDRLGEAFPRASAGGAAAILLAGVAFVPWERVDFKRSTLRRHWKTRTLLEPHPIEETVRRLEARLGVGRADVVLLDMADGYLNHRLGYRQRGPMAPFQALLTLADTSSFVTTALESRALVTCVDPDCPGWIAELNAPGLASARGFRLRAEPDGDGWNIRRAP
jgi:hypothetical protein